MNEWPQVFGRNNHLVGICAEPGPDQAKPNAPAILLLNAGFIHRIGPFRFYVDLARLLTRHGYTILRVDLSGIGDSLPSKDNRPEQDRIMSDISDAMDMLHVKRKFDKFILCGLCWGADISHDCAVLDTRVVGAVMLDTYGYPTFGFFLHDRVFPLMRLSKWTSFIRHKFFNSSLKTGMQRKKLPPEVFDRQFPSKEKTVAEIQKLISRNAKLLYIYSGGVPIYYNYGKQFWDMFKEIHFSGCVESAYFKDADHLYSHLDVRKRMFDCILTWLNVNFK
jgi:pimeloyl-ACP methyl ester carboxylesterase